MDENKLPPKPSLIRICILLSLVLALFFYSILDKDPISDFSRRTYRHAILGAIGELNGKENIRWANFKMYPHMSFENDEAFDNEIVNGTTSGGWNTDIGPDCEWEDGYPTPTGGFIVCKPDYDDLGKRYKLFRTAATRLSPGSWSELDRP